MEKGSEWARSCFLGHYIHFFSVCVAAFLRSREVTFMIVNSGFPYYSRTLQTFNPFASTVDFLMFFFPILGVTMTVVGQSLCCTARHLRHGNLNVLLSLIFHSLPLGLNLCKLWFTDREREIYGLNFLWLAPLLVAMIFWFLWLNGIATHLDAKALARRFLILGTLFLGWAAFSIFTIFQERLLTVLLHPGEEVGEFLLIFGGGVVVSLAYLYLLDSLSTRPVFKNLAN